MLLAFTLWNPITDIGKSAADAVFGALWTQIGDAAASVTTALWRAITSSTDVSFTSAAWTGSSTKALLTVVLELSGAVMLLMVILAVIRAALRGDPAAAARAVLVDVPVSCLGSLALVGVTAALVAASDQAADHIMGLAPHAALSSFAANWPGIVSGLQFAGGLGGILFILGAFMVWIELIVRAGLLYLMVATAPLLLAMRVFPGFAPAWKKFAETAVAIILSKVFVAIALVLGLSLTTGGSIPTGSAATTGQNIGQMLAGIGMMTLAAFAPFVLLRFAPVVEAALAAQGISHLPARAAQRAAWAGSSAQGLARLAGNSGSPGTGLVGSASAGALAGAASGGPGGGEPPGAGAGPLAPSPEDRGGGGGNGNGAASARRTGGTSGATKASLGSEASAGSPGAAPAASRDGSTPSSPTLSSRAPGPSAGQPSSPAGTSRRRGGPPPESSPPGPGPRASLPRRRNGAQDPT